MQRYKASKLGICSVLKRWSSYPKMKTHFKTLKSSCCHLVKCKAACPIPIFWQPFCGSGSVRQRAMWTATAQKQTVALSLAAVVHCLSSEEFPELLLRLFQSQQADGEVFLETYEQWQGRKSKGSKQMKAKPPWLLFGSSRWLQWQKCPLNGFSNLQDLMLS